jgi:hypothetical protein
MEVFLYEDQTGLMIFPEKKYIKDNQIVKLFNNSVDLYIEKIGNNLKIYSHLNAYKTSSRPLGYYIIYKDSYNDNIFTNLKIESQKILQNLLLQLRPGHSDNIIFENIEKFDNKFQRNWDIDLILNAINYGKNLDFTAGNISEISAFCTEILRRSNNIIISLSSKKVSLGNINILINKKNAESLKRDEKTEYALNETRERIREKTKIEKGEPGRVKIKEGFSNIRQGVDTLRNAGYNLEEVQQSFDQISTGEIFSLNIKGMDRSKNKEIRKENKEIRKDFEKDVEKNINIEKDKEKGNFIESVLKICIIIAAIAVIVVLGSIFFPPDHGSNIKDRINNLIYGPTPTPTPIQTLSPIPSPTISPTPAPMTYNISGFLLDITNKGLSSWSVSLLDNENGSQSNKTYTDDSGYYIFNNLKNGSYNITENIKEGYNSINGPNFKIINITGKDVTVNFTNSNVVKSTIR